MSNRQQPPLPASPVPELGGGGGWTPYDYAMAAAFALPFVVCAPLLAIPPLWVTVMMAPSD
jgi:hypothetical protein